ncbi:MAG TPA: GspH/FimT family pseudopilin [Gemmatimonadales bacterium]|nr:GspH/FimT family pseudopilin [Gemmatimonadales bacterium]
MCSTGSPRHPRTLSRAGLTLIELMMVIVLMGLVLGIALPRVNIEGARVNATIRSLTAALSVAQRVAVTQQHNVIVAFDSASSRIRIHEDKNNNGIMDAGERVTSTPLGDGVLFGRGSVPALTYTTGGTGSVTFNFTRTSTGYPAIIFRRDGSASENGGFYLTTVKGAASGNTNWSRAAEVIRSTGRILWYSYASGAWTLEQR